MIIVGTPQSGNADGCTKPDQNHNAAGMDLVESQGKTLKTLSVTTQLFGPITLLCVLKCGTFLFYLLNEGSV